MLTLSGDRRCNEPVHKLSVLMDGVSLHKEVLALFNGYRVRYYGSTPKVAPAR